MGAIEARCVFAQFISSWEGEIGICIKMKDHDIFQGNKNLTTNDTSPKE